MEPDLPEAEAEAQVVVAEPVAQAADVRAASLWDQADRASALTAGQEPRISAAYRATSNSAPVVGQR
jgi:hypothetical protein